MLFKKSILISIVSLSFCACSENGNLIQERQRTQPPQNAGDVGVLVEGAKKEQVTQLLQAHPQAQVRVLSEPHGLYEIFGIQLQEVKDEYSGLSEPNQFFSTQKIQRHAELMSFTPQPGLQVGDLKPCVTTTDGPTATLQVDAPQSLADGATIELGAAIKVNGLKSHAQGTTPPAVPLKMDFVVLFPDSAPIPDSVNSGTSTEFTPNVLGLYKIFLVVQDGNNSCAMDGISFIVTAHPPYAGPSVPAITVDLSKFDHLNLVSAQEAWKTSEGEGMIIAIVDSGVDYNHPELASNILLNEKEIPSNGIDDDGNGYIDDYVGYDFANSNPWPYDDDSHGTHVAGLAAARDFGMARKAKILPVKAMTPVGGDIGTIAAAIRYAVDRGANIINLSLGAAVRLPPQVLVSAMSYAQSKNVLVVVAAGNGDPDTGLGYSIDDSPVYPASLHSANMITVAAFDPEDVLSTYSNFGARTVDVVAPGGSEKSPMISAAFQNPQGLMFIGMSGTSMATPVVSGIAAQVWSHSPKLTLKQLHDILLNAGGDQAALKGKTVSGKHIDALSAISK